MRHPRLEGLTSSITVIPAKAGIQGVTRSCYRDSWMPAYAGMTNRRIAYPSRQLNGATSNQRRNARLNADSSE